MQILEPTACSVDRLLRVTLPPPFPFSLPRRPAVPPASQRASRVPGAVWAARTRAWQGAPRVNGRPRCMAQVQDQEQADNSGRRISLGGPGTAADNIGHYPYQRFTLPSHTSFSFLLFSSPLASLLPLPYFSFSPPYLFSSFSHPLYCSLPVPLPLLQFFLLSDTSSIFTFNLLLLYLFPLPLPFLRFYYGELYSDSQALPS